MIVKKPLIGHEIHHNDFHYIIKEGVEIEIDDKFKQTLISEGVIKSGATKPNNNKE